MNVAVIGHPGELRRAIVAELERRGMTVSDKAAERVVCLAPEMVDAALATPAGLLGLSAQFIAALLPIFVGRHTGGDQFRLPPE